MSPLRRTIETACHALKDHPDKNDLILCVTPLARERMQWLNTLLVSAEELQDFCKEMSQLTGLKIDLSFLDAKNYKLNGAVWFLEEMKGEH